MKSIQLLQMLEEINYGRRDVLGAIAMSLATVGLGVLVSTGTPSSDTAPGGVTLIGPKASLLPGAEDYYKVHVA